MEHWPRGTLRTLPKRIPPVEDETTRSYLRRLARGHHLDDTELIGYLNPTLAGPNGSRRRFDIALTDLATVSGISESHLAYALPELRHQFPERASLRLHGRPQARSPCQERLACRKCMLTKNITTAVTVWTHQDQNVCLRHHLWTGAGVCYPEDQLNLAELPEISNAQIHHRNLIRRRGRQHVQYFYDDARNIINRSTTVASDIDLWTRGACFFPGRQAAELPWSFDDAARYPQVVSLLGVLSSPYWRAQASSKDPADRKRFYLHVFTQDELIDAVPLPRLSS
jgi:hypothetical protein